MTEKKRVGNYKGRAPGSRNKKYKLVNKRVKQTLLVCVTEKKCKICNQVKSSSEFNKDVRSRDFLTHKCRKCIADYVRKYYARTPGLRHKRNQQIKRNRIKYNARRVISNALHSGAIKRQACIICGESRTHAHHPNYNEKSNIMWLCVKHHRAWHRVFLAEEIK